MTTWEYLVLELPSFRGATHAPGASAAVNALNEEGERGWATVGMTPWRTRESPHSSIDPDRSRSRR
jgi:hypothetical protein